MFTHLLALSPLQQSLLKIDITNGQSSTLVDGLTDGPDGIVVDPDRKYVYWTNMGAPGLPEGRVPKTDDDLTSIAQTDHWNAPGWMAPGAPTSCLSDRLSPGNS